MGELKRFWKDSLRIYSRYELTDEQLVLLSRLAHAPESSTNGVKRNSGLSGRTELKSCEVGGIGSVVIKSYRRGGIFRGLLSSVFMRMGQSRSRREFKMLEKVRSFGVNAPEPIAYIEEGEFWYRAWLVLRTIPSDLPLIEISETDETRAIKLGASISAQVSQLIEHRIHHVDLHPGNVVVNPTDEVFIVDFDKAVEYSGEKNRLRDLYLRRWRRAVIKHKLPHLLSESISLHLRAQYG